MITRASWNVPYDPDEDPWHAPNACVEEAAFVTDLVVRHLAAARTIPDDLLAMWDWYARGHWPCGMSETRLVVL